MTLVYVGVAMVPLMLIASLAVDFGRVSAAKIELQSAVDAAARAASMDLRTGTGVNTAISVASLNSVDGRSLVLAVSDVTLGQYDPATLDFTVGATPVNAVRVRASRAGTNGIPMSFASVAGFRFCSIYAESIAVDDGISITASAPASANPTGAQRGFIGIDSINMNGPLQLRAWNSQTQTNLGSTAWSAAQTKGNSNLNNGVFIDGELHTGSGTASMNGATVSKGIKVTNNSTMNFTAPTTPSSGVTHMGNYNGPAGASQTFAAGKYYFNTFQVPSGKSVIFSGPVELYVNGSFNVSGAITTFGNIPGNLKVNGVSGSGMDIGNNASPLYAEIYAPNGPMNLNQRTFYGSVIAKSINVNSSFNMFVDGRSTINGGPSSGGGASTYPPNTAVKVRGVRVKAFK